MISSSTVMRSRTIEFPRTPRAVRKLIVPAALFGVGIAVAIVMGLTRTGMWQIPLFASSCGASFIAWVQFPWRDSWTRYLSFGGVALLACSINRLFYIGDVICGGEHFSEWPFTANAPEVALLKGELATVGGLFVAVTTWIAAGGSRYPANAISSIPRSGQVGVLSLVYGSALGVLLIMRAAPDAVQSFGQFVPTLHSAGMAAAFFLTITLTSLLSTRLALIVLMGSPFLYIALGTGMKENIFVAILPLAIVLWLGSKSIVSRITLILSGLVLIALITSYVGYYRAQVWSAHRDVELEEVLEEYVAEITNGSFLAAVEYGLLQFSERSNSSIHHGWAVSYADTYGYEPHLVFAPMLYVFIPRMIWRDKPDIRQGWEYSGLLFGDDYLINSDSSSAAGMFAGFYLGAGWIAVGLGAIGIGLVMATLTALSWKIGGATFTALFTFAMIPYAMRVEENWAVGGLAGPIVNFGFLVVIFLIARLGVTLR